MLTYQRAAELLHYDPESGVLTWIVKPSTNGRIKVGDAAGFPHKSTGYLRITVDGKRYSAHRLAWLLHTGEFPPDQLDHINCIRTDNRIANLRPATNRQNQQNKGMYRSKNTSGFKGVSFNKKAGKWVANISIPLLGYRYLGYFDTPEDAAACYEGAARLFHAEFAYFNRPKTKRAVQGRNPEQPEKNNSERKQDEF